MAMASFGFEELGKGVEMDANAESFGRGKLTEFLNLAEACA